MRFNGKKRLPDATRGLTKTKKKGSPPRIHGVECSITRCPVHVNPVVRSFPRTYFRPMNIEMSRHKRSDDRGESLVVTGIIR